MKLIDLKCPSCGAEMKVNQDLKRVICVYCGKEMFVDDEIVNTRVVNGFDYGYEMEMGRLKAQEEFRQQQALQEEQERQEAEEARRREEQNRIEMYELEEALKNSEWRRWFVISLLIVIAGVILIAVSRFSGVMSIVGIILFLGAIGLGSVMHGKIYGNKPTEYTDNDEYVLFPKGLEPFTVCDYTEILQKLKDAGFTNITCRNLHDVVIGLLTKEDTVQSITVSNKVIFTGGKWYPKYVPIVITYHGK